MVILLSWDDWANQKISEYTTGDLVWYANESFIDQGSGYSVCNVSPNIGISIPLESTVLYFKMVTILTCIGKWLLA